MLYIQLPLLLGFIRNLDSDFIKKKIFFSTFVENGHIHLHFVILEFIVRKFLGDRQTHKHVEAFSFIY